METAPQGFDPLPRRQTWTPRTEKKRETYQFQAVTRATGRMVVSLRVRSPPPPGARDGQHHHGWFGAPLQTPGGAQQGAVLAPPLEGAESW